MSPCEGTGVCPPCEGTGVCPPCEGTGVCPPCEGTGVCPHEKGLVYPPCKGTGVCSQCEGTGVCPPSEGTGVCPPLPANLEELRQRIIAALQTVTQDMLQLFGRSWSTELTCAVSLAERILIICEIGYEIHISLNLSLTFGGIIPYCYAISLFSIINLDHDVSVIFTLQIILIISKHPAYIYIVNYIKSHNTK